MANTLKGKLAALEAKVAGLPGDPADASDILALINALDTLIDGVKAKTDNLPVSPCATADVANALVDVKNKDNNATFSRTTDSLEAISEAVAVINAALASGIVTGNIKAGITILGVAGKTEVVDTTEAAQPAGEADIANGKVAFVNGVKVTGTHV
jgi:hypothetical protein